MLQIRTCISDIKRLGELHKKEQLDVTDKNLLSNLVENVPTKNKLKSDRRKYRSKHQLIKEDTEGKQTQAFNCNLLSIGIPSRTMPTFSLAHLANNNNSNVAQHKVFESTEEDQKATQPPQLLPPTCFQNNLPLQPLIASSISPSVLSTPSPKDPTALMFSSLEKELLSLLDVEELSKLMPMLSKDGAAMPESLSTSLIPKARVPGVDDDVVSAALHGNSIACINSLTP